MIMFFIFLNFSLLVHSKNRFQIVTFLNGAYKDLLFNFVCNMEKLNLKNLLHVYMADATLNYYLEAKNISYTVIDSVNFHNKSSVYGHSDYWYISKQKTKAFKMAVQKYNVFLFTDVDVLFLKNPFETVGKMCMTDLCFQTDSRFGYGIVNSGFFFVKRTFNTISFFSEALKLLNEPIFSKLGDQEILNHLLKTKEFSNIYSFLDKDKFRNGYNETIWTKTFLNSQHDVIVIHNNFIISIEKKIERFKKISSWYVHDENCYFG